MTIPIKMRLKNIYYCLTRRFPLRLLWYDMDLATIPKGTFFGHPYGITINANTRFGRKCAIRQNVTMGNRWTNDGSEQGAIIGNRVTFSVGCTILGPVSIGDCAVIGAGAVVLHDVPPGATVVGNPAKIVRIDPTRRLKICHITTHDFDKKWVEYEVDILSTQYTVNRVNIPQCDSIIRYPMQLLRFVHDILYDVSMDGYHCHGVRALMIGICIKMVTTRYVMYEPRHDTLNEIERIMVRYTDAIMLPDGDAEFSSTLISAYDKMMRAHERTRA